MSEWVVVTTKKFKFPYERQSRRLDTFLSELLENDRNVGSRSRVSELISAGFVRINGKIELKKGRRLTGGEFIEVMIATKQIYRSEPVDAPLDIIHEEDDFAVINKPPGMIVHASCGSSEPTLMNIVIAKFAPSDSLVERGRAGIVHRIDRGTSGIVVVAKNERGHARLSELFRERLIIKKYLCVVRGRPKEDIGEVNRPISRHPTVRTKMTTAEPYGKEARTRYRLLSYNADKEFSLLAVRILTGRTHQIRVHMSSIGHPLIGDRLYGGPEMEVERPMLHAASVAFNYLGRERRFHAPLPDDFSDFIRKNFPEIRANSVVTDVAAMKV